MSPINWYPGYYPPVMHQPNPTPSDWHWQDPGFDDFGWGDNSFEPSTDPHGTQTALFGGFDPMTLIFLLFSLLSDGLFGNNNSGDDTGATGSTGGTGSTGTTDPEVIAANESARITHDGQITGGDGETYNINVSGTEGPSDPSNIYNNLKPDVYTVVKDGDFEVQVGFNRNTSPFIVAYGDAMAAVEGAAMEEQLPGAAPTDNSEAPQDAQGPDGEEGAGEAQNTEGSEGESAPASDEAMAASAEMQQLDAAYTEMVESPNLLRTVTITAGHEELAVNADGKVLLIDKDNNAVIQKSLDVGESYQTEDGTTITRTENGYQSVSADGRYTVNITQVAATANEGDSLDVEVVTSDEGVSENVSGLLGETFDAGDEQQSGPKLDLESYKPHDRDFDDVDTAQLMAELIRFDKNGDGLSSRELREASDVLAQENKEALSNAASRLADEYDGKTFFAGIGHAHYAYGGFLYLRSPSVDVNGDYRLNYSTDENGNVTHSELFYLNDMHGNPDQLSSEDIENANGQMTPEHWMDIRNAALEMDTDGDGTLSVSELEEGLENLGTTGNANLFLHFREMLYDLKFSFPWIPLKGAIEDPQQGASAPAIWPWYERIFDPDGNGKIELGTEQDNIFKDVARRSDFQDNFIDIADYRPRYYYFDIFSPPPSATGDPEVVIPQND